MPDRTAGWVPAKRSRRERGLSSVAPTDVVAFAPVYVMHEPDRGAVVNPFLANRKRGWWDAVGRETLVDDAVVYVELESEAVTLRTFKTDLIDGLLQTPEYAAAVIRANQSRVSETLVQQRVEARTQRQARLRGANALQVEAIITEG